VKQQLRVITRYTAVGRTNDSALFDGIMVAIELELEPVTSYGVSIVAVML